MLNQIINTSISDRWHWINEIVNGKKEVSSPEFTTLYWQSKKLGNLQRTLRSTLK